MPKRNFLEPRTCSQMKLSILLAVLATVAVAQRSLSDAEGDNQDTSAPPSVGSDTSDTSDDGTTQTVSPVKAPVGGNAMSTASPKFDDGSYKPDKYKGFDDGSYKPQGVSTTTIKTTAGMSKTTAGQTTAGNTAGAALASVLGNPGAGESLCNQNMQTCTSACGWNSKPTVNKCDPSTLRWDCQCPSGILPSTSDGSFPVEQRVCEQEFTLCQTGCNRVPGEQQGACFSQCSSKSRCGAQGPAKLKGKAPPKRNATADAKRSALDSDAPHMAVIGTSTVAAGIFAAVVALL